MGRQLAYIAAINEAIAAEMARDPSVLYFGQNIATTENDVPARRGAPRWPGWPTTGWPS
jgi:pyruvate/2-oxoglutarate/acetoin dehydrogenase E1 component